MFPKDTVSQKNLARANAYDPLPGSGTIMDRTKCNMVVVYDFAVNGGAISTIPLNDDQGNAAFLPQGAIVTNVVCHVITAVTSSGTTGLALNCLTGGDLVASQVKGTLTIGAYVAGVPVGTAATRVGPVTAAGGTQVAATIITTAITAGKIYFDIEYVIHNIT